MPSILRSLPILALSLAVFQVAAAPVTVTVSACASSPTQVQATIINKIQKIPNVPKSDTGTLPTSNLTLRHITLGHGTQNYTCASPDSKPVQVGAVATLYDITALGGSPPFLLSSLPATVVYMSLPAAPATPLTVTKAISIPAGVQHPVIGHHYFLADGTPTFDLNTVNEIMFAKKLASIKAPAGSSVGPSGTGAVDWLLLGDKGGSKGVTEVYRVVTAGGNPPASCQGQGPNALGVGLIEIPYAAEYWFYG